MTQSAALHAQREDENAQAEHAAPNRTRPDAPHEDGRPETARRTLAVHSPGDGSLLGEVPVHTPEEVDAEIARAHAAQARWGALSPKARGKALKRWRDLVVDHADELAGLIARENGKTRQEALFAELVTFTDLATFFSRRAHKVLKRRRIPVHLLKIRRSYLHYAPRGVVGVISPWNFPFVIPIGEVFMALLAGNAVVLKPSEVTPLIALRAKELFDQAGLDPDLFRIVTGDGATGAALVEGDVQLVCFTGSVATGRRIAARCGERLIPCVMELGGKAPFIVCEDADVDRAAHAAVYGGFMNSGQVCASVERIYVHRAVAEPFTRKVVELASGLRQGDPLDHDTDVGAITFEGQLGVAESHVADAVDKGARVETGGERSDAIAGGRFFRPTVLTGVTHEMKVTREETFGPLLPIVTVDDEEEALRLAGESHLGLLGYVFTRDLSKGRRYAEQLRIGTVMVNDVLTTYSMPETPWMGVKDSGFGKVHSDDGLRALCEERHVSLPAWWAPQPKRELWWHPYGRRIHELTLKALRLFKWF